MWGQDEVSSQDVILLKSKALYNIKRKHLQIAFVQYANFLNIAFI